MKEGTINMRSNVATRTMTLGNAITQCDTDLDSFSKQKWGANIISKFGQPGLTARNFICSLPAVGAFSNYVLPLKVNPVSATVKQKLASRLPYFLAIIRTNTFGLLVNYLIPQCMNPETIGGQLLRVWWQNVGGNVQDIEKIFNSVKVYKYEILLPSTFKPSWNAEAIPGQNNFLNTTSTDVNVNAKNIFMAAPLIVGFLENVGLPNSRKWINGYMTSVTNPNSGVTTSSITAGTYIWANVNQQKFDWMLLPLIQYFKTH